MRYWLVFYPHKIDLAKGTGVPNFEGMMGLIEISRKMWHRYKKSGNTVVTQEKGEKK